MKIETLEEEVVRLRATVVTQDDVLGSLREKETTLTRRNVALYERVRFIEHELAEFHEKLARILADGVDRK